MTSKTCIYEPDASLMAVRYYLLRKKIESIVGICFKHGCPTFKQSRTHKDLEKSIIILLIASYKRDYEIEDVEEELFACRIMLNDLWTIGLYAYPAFPLLNVEGYTKVTPKNSQTHDSKLT
jgi:hypothetical protein